jgi:hypothetical protein
MSTEENLKRVVAFFDGQQHAFEANAAANRSNLDDEAFSFAEHLARTILDNDADFRSMSLEDDTLFSVRSEAVLGTLMEQVSNAGDEDLTHEDTGEPLSDDESTELIKTVNEIIGELDVRHALYWGDPDNGEASFWNFNIFTTDGLILDIKLGFD